MRRQRPHTLHPLILLVAAVFVSGLRPDSTAAQCAYDILRPSEWQPAAYGDGTHIPAIAASNDTLAMGAYTWEQWYGFGDDRFRTPGIVLFEHDGSDWRFLQNIVDPEARVAPSFEFGRRIVLKNHDMLTSSKSGLHHYRRIDGIWQYQGVLNIKADVDFYSIGYDGLQWRNDRLFASMKAKVNEEDGYVNSVGVLQQDEQGNWTLEHVIPSPNLQIEPSFGRAFSSAGNRLVVGAPYAFNQTGIRGRLYFYRFHNDEWIPDGIYRSSDATDNGIGNRGLKMVGTTVAAATPFDLHGGGPEDGHLHIIERTDAETWERVQHLVVPTLPYTNDPYADSNRFLLDFDGERIAVARSARHLAGQSGSIHVAEHDGTEWVLGPGVRPHHSNPDGGAVELGFSEFTAGYGANVCLWNDTAMVPAVRILLSEQWHPAGIPVALAYDLTDGLGSDFNNNGICDDAEFANNELDADNDYDGRPDIWEIDNGFELDCNGNLVIDRIEYDCNGDGIPNDCPTPCNVLGLPEDCTATYDVGNDASPPGHIWSIALGDLPKYQVWLRPIRVVEHGEVATSFRFARPSAFEDSTIHAVIYRDVDHDGDPHNAELLFSKAMTVGNGPRTHMVNVSLPNIHLGEAGDTVYIGLAMLPARFGERYVISGDHDDSSNRTTAHVLFTYDTPIDIENLSDIELLHLTADYFTPAFELDTSAATICCATTDLNHDGMTDVSDLLQLLSAWGECTIDCSADVNGDFTIDINDLLTMLAFWGACDP